MWLALLGHIAGLNMVFRLQLHLQSCSCLLPGEFGFPNILLATDALFTQHYSKVTGSRQHDYSYMGSAVRRHHHSVGNESLNAYISVLRTFPIPPPVHVSCARVTVRICLETTSEQVARPRCCMTCTQMCREATHVCTTCRNVSSVLLGFTAFPLHRDVKRP